MRKFCIVKVCRLILKEAIAFANAIAAFLSFASAAESTVLSLFELAVRELKRFTFFSVIDAASRFDMRIVQDISWTIH